MISVSVGKYTENPGKAVVTGHVDVVRTLQALFCAATRHARRLASASVTAVADNESLIRSNAFTFAGDFRSVIQRSAWVGRSPRDRRLQSAITKMGNVRPGMLADGRVPVSTPPAAA